MNCGMLRRSIIRFKGRLILNAGISNKFISDGVMV